MPEAPKKMIKGALYVLAVEIEDPDGADNETREGIMRVLKGALRRESGGGGTHGMNVTLYHAACKIMQYQLSAEKGDDHGITGE